jgi:hypothetical protein
MLKKPLQQFPYPLPSFPPCTKNPSPSPLQRGPLLHPLLCGTHSLPSLPRARTNDPPGAPPPRRPRRLSLPSPLRGRGSRHRPLLRRAARPPAPPRMRRRCRVEPARTAGGQHLSGSGHEAKIRSFFRQTVTRVLTERTGAGNGGTASASPPPRAPASSSSPDQCGRGVRWWCRRARDGRGQGGGGRAVEGEAGAPQQTVGAAGGAEAGVGRRRLSVRQPLLPRRGDWRHHLQHREP